MSHIAIVITLPNVEVYLTFLNTLFGYGSVNRLEETGGLSKISLFDSVLFFREGDFASTGMELILCVDDVMHIHRTAQRLGCIIMQEPELTDMGFCISFQDPNSIRWNIVQEE